MEQKKKDEPFWRFYSQRLSTSMLKQLFSFYIHLHFNYFEIFPFILLFFSSSFTVIHSLRDVRVKIPSAVRKSDTVVLNCYYDMEGDSLYSVKWYKGKFFDVFQIIFHLFTFDVDVQMELSAVKNIISWGFKLFCIFVVNALRGF